MFWKSTRETSLAVRLSLWYTGSAFLLLLVATGFLYWMLAAGFEREDDQYLREKVNTIRTLLRDDDFRTLRWEVEGESTTRPAVRVLSRVLTTAGKTVIETTGMAADLPPAFFPAPGAIEDRTTFGRLFRVLSENFRNYRIQVGVEVTYEQALLTGYRRKLWVVLSLGLLGSMLIGCWIARRGIRPVEEIAAAMRRIRSSTLDERIAITGLPAELSALAATFNEMLDRLEDSFARLARFSSDLAHELRTPVNNLRGEVEVALARTRSGEEYRDVLGSALEECLRLSRIIDSLLFLARAENPETQIRREPLDVAAELVTVLEFYEPAAAEAGVALRLDAASGTAHLDRTLFQRATGNLIENALAHTPRGGSITLAASPENGVLVVTISDTGCGIAPEHIAHVFDRFYRVDPARAQSSGGAGLGLALVKSIATLHGGKVSLQSEPGRGTRVTLAFPAAS